MTYSQSPLRLFSYPQGDEDADVPEDLQRLTSELDNVALSGTGSAAARPAPLAGPGHEVGRPGTFWHAVDTGTVSLCDGTKWHTLLYVGEIRPTVRATAPEGWLICDGSPLLRTDYPALFNAIGGTSSPYGLPDGTHFSLPDLRARVPVGAGQQGGGANRLRGAGGGSEAATMPPHNHGGGVHSHYNPGGMYTTFAVGLAADAGAQPGWFPDAFNSYTANCGVILNTEGSGDNMPPFQVVNYMIKT